MACELIPLQCFNCFSYHISKLGICVRQCLTSRYRFLLAKLHMDSLTKQPHRKALRLALENLPPELDETYNDALARISSQDKEDTIIAHQVLGWITHATRPLTMKQLQHALSVEPEQTDLDEETLMDEELLISTCLGLVTVDHTSKEVRLVHYTAQKYFEHRLLEIMPYNHIRIASTCLTYMSFKACQNIDEFTSDEEIEDLGNRYPLLDYAGSNWGIHAQRDDQKLVQQVLRFLRPNATYLSSRLMIGGFKSLTQMPTHKHWDYPIKYEARISGHNMAAYFGLQHTLTTLLSEATGTKEMIQSTLLICSARENQTLAQLLLDRGANINTCSWLGYTPLHLAAAKGSLAVTKFLLRSNADVNTRQSPRSSTALQHAAKNGHAAILQALLEHGANVNIMRHDTDRRSEYTALRLAVLIQDVASVNVILDGGADINALHLESQRLLEPLETDLHDVGTTVLFDAVSEKQEAIVNLLLDRGADVNMGDLTPLSCAMTDRNGRMISLLIENGADLHLMERQLMGLASHVSSKRVLSEEFSFKKILGAALVDVAYTLKPGSTVDILINAGADIDILSITGCDLETLEWRDKMTMQDLSERVNSGGLLLDFPLLAAARNGNESLVQLLLNRGAKTWGIEKESWLQQAMFAKSKANPTGGCSEEFVLASYKKIISSDDLMEWLRGKGYSEELISTWDRMATNLKL